MATALVHDDDPRVVSEPTKERTSPRWLSVLNRIGDVEPVYQVLHTSALHVDTSYQRPQIPRLVASIGSHFDLLLAGTLVVSDRGPSIGMFVVDGQQRLAGARRAGQGTLAALVVKGLTIEEEALVFQALNEKRVAVSALARFRSAVRAREQWAVDLNDIVRSYGGSVKAVGIQTADPIAAVEALRTTYIRSGPQTLHWVLGTIRDATGTVDGASSSLIRGLHVLRSAEHDNLDYHRLVERIQETGLNELRNRAKQYTQVTHESGRSWYLALLDVYNERLTPGGKGKRRIEPKGKVTFKKDSAPDGGKD